MLTPDKKCSFVEDFLQKNTDYTEMVESSSLKESFMLVLRAIC